MSAADEPRPLIFDPEHYPEDRRAADRERIEAIRGNLESYHCYDCGVDDTDDVQFLLSQLSALSEALSAMTRNRDELFVAWNKDNDLRHDAEEALTACQQERDALKQNRCLCGEPSEEGTIGIQAACPEHGDGSAYAEAKRQYWAQEQSSADLTACRAQGLKENKPTDIFHSTTEGKCAGCGGSHPFDTTVPSVVWNAVIRGSGLADYLCATCILKAFVRAGQSFTATLWSDEFDGVPIEVRIREQGALDAQAVQDENNTLRDLLTACRAQGEAREQCICAAIRLQNGEVWRGHRHDNCIEVAGKAGVSRNDIAEAEQGFITSSNRFVGRENGAWIQNRAGIVSAQTGKSIAGMLFSEDLYLRDWREAAALSSTPTEPKA